MKTLLLVAGVLFTLVLVAKEENVYAVPLSSKEEWIGTIELPVTITGRVSSASSQHLVSFNPRMDYGSMRAAIYTNTGTGTVFGAELYVGEESQGVPLPYNMPFSGSTHYVLSISASAYEPGASYAVRIGLPDAIDVAFDGNGGSAFTNKMTYTLGGRYGDFPTASRAGYDFTGWGTAVTNGVMLSTNTQVCAGYTTLYAQWKVDPTYPVTPTNDAPAVTNYYVSFNANGGTGTMSNQTFTIGVEQSLTSNAFTRSGYSFRGWAMTAAGSVEYADGAVFTNSTGGVTNTLYANWMISSDSILSANVAGVTWHYTAENGEATIQNLSNGEYVAAVETSARGTLTIPENFGTNRVVEIGERAFAGCSSVANIVIPLGVKKIGDCAFAGCTSLSPGITIPESVESLGACVFTNCSALKIVRYQGDCPEADEELYAGTPASLISGVLRVRSGWMLEDGISTSGQDGDDGDDDDDNEETSSGGGTLAKWPEGSYARRVLWWVTQPVYKVTFWSVPGDYHSTITKYYIPDRELGSLPGEPKNADDRDGYTFLGWFTKPYGGTEVTEEMVVNSSFSVYAHWRKDDDPENLSDVEYNLGSAYSYDGYLLDGDGNMAGTIQLKTSRERLSRAKQVKKVTANATIQLLGEGKIRLKGSLGEDLSGTLASTKASDDRKLEMELSGSGMGGTFGEYTVVGTRNIYGKRTPLDRTKALAADDSWMGYYVVALKAESDESSLGNGYVGLSVQVKKNGRVRVTGTLPDGTKVASSGRMEVMDGNACVLPVAIPLYRGKKGGFGFLLSFNESGVSASAVSSWVNTDVPFTAALAAEAEGAGYASGISSVSAFSLEEPFSFEGVEESLLPADVEVKVTRAGLSTPKAGRVKFNAEDGTYEDSTESGNPSGLTLSASSENGTFSGKFKVFAVTEAGKSKKYTATVRGVVLDGVGYGTATIKKIGSVPVTVRPE